MEAIGIRQGPEIIADLLDNGFLLTEPGLEPGEVSETITTVVRREHINQQSGVVTPVIDMYPDFGEGGDPPYGTYRFTGHYLNKPADIERFLMLSGFDDLDELPLYDSQGPLQRTPGRDHRCEILVHRSFQAIKIQDGTQVINGVTVPKWKFIRIGDAAPVNTSGQQASYDGPGAILGDTQMTDYDVWLDKVMNAMIRHFENDDADDVRRAVEHLAQGNAIQPQHSQNKITALVEMTLMGSVVPEETF